MYPQFHSKILKVHDHFFSYESRFKRQQIYLFISTRDIHSQLPSNLFRISHLSFVSDIWKRITAHHFNMGFYFFLFLFEQKVTKVACIHIFVKNSKQSPCYINHVYINVIAFSSFLFV